jgi:preprotein translocase subunit SecF
MLDMDGGDDFFYTGSDEHTSHKKHKHKKKKHSEDAEDISVEAESEVESEVDVEAESEIDVGENEFVVGDEEEEPKAVGGYGKYNGGYIGGAMVYKCFLSLIIVAAVIFLYTLFKRRRSYSKRSYSKRSYTSHPEAASQPSTVGPVFDNTLVPATYFDYNMHGRKYINWS